MTDDRQRWLEFLAAERRRRVEYQSPAAADDARARLEAELEAIYQRIITVTAGPPWSLSDASIIERLAVFGRWPPGVEVDPEQEETELARWFTEHGYSQAAPGLLHHG